MEIGIYSFGETRIDPRTGRQLEARERVAHLLDEIQVADSVGLDVFGLGEHHRPDYVSSTPATILAAAAARTERIRLTSAVTVLSSDDPVRVFQDYATLDLISGGRAEIMVGRGSFTESFPLFGQDLSDYDELFSQKLELLLRIRADERVDWPGGHRPAIEGRLVLPRPIQDPLPVWVAVGGNPPSVVRAASLGLPMALAIIGGMPERFVPFFDLYRDAARRAGHDPKTLPLSINAHGFLADDAEEAAELAFPPFAETMGRIGTERGWPPPTRAQFDAERRLRGAVFLGDPDAFVEKILFQHELFGHDRFLVQLTVGPMDHDRVLRAIELLGTEVAPRVRGEIRSRQAAHSPPGGTEKEADGARPPA
ncbi:MAG: LLM class flavin-dependent oxidoreductase [Gemmatimonadota bacterium]|nr:LLM class flavin-dependent oxidoreductase [Gemmatimonadota bacterium]